MTISVERKLSAFRLIKQYTLIGSHSSCVTSVCDKAISRDRNWCQFSRDARKWQLESDTQAIYSMEVYEAKYDYCDDCGESLLSFKKGDKFLITHKADGGWWVAQNLSSNEIGYIPGAFVEVFHFMFFPCPCHLLVLGSPYHVLFEIQINTKPNVSLVAIR